MKTKIIRIGNSQGVRIPKPFIEESGLTEEIRSEDLRFI
ncbi:AbrB/MazE/SpoVT family DNA-binding domain-containing protein [Rhodohalobacter halophilus]